MKRKKKINVIMLPTQELSNIIFNIDEMKLEYHDILTSSISSKKLLIVVNDELKEGDFCINSQMTFFQLEKGFDTKTLKLTKALKIIAATEDLFPNSNKKFKKLAKISKSFKKTYIKTYNRFKPITTISSKRLKEIIH